MLDQRIVTEAMEFALRQYAQDGTCDRRYDPTIPMLAGSINGGPHTAEWLQGIALAADLVIRYRLNLHSLRAASRVTTSK